MSVLLKNYAAKLFQFEIAGCVSVAVIGINLGKWSPQEAKTACKNSNLDFIEAVH